MTPAERNIYYDPDRRRALDDPDCRAIWYAQVLADPHADLLRPEPGAPDPAAVAAFAELEREIACDWADDDDEHPERAAWTRDVTVPTVLLDELDGIAWLPEGAPPTMELLAELPGPTGDPADEIYLATLFGDELPPVWPRLAAALERIPERDCQCGLHDRLTADELLALGAGCTGPAYVCGRLDQVRRAVA